MANVCYVGNFNPPFSTENDVRRTLVDMGHQVGTLQENEIDAWVDFVAQLGDGDEVPDLILWTSTYDYSQKVGHEIQREMLFLARLNAVPTIALHLDRWWGLERWKRVLAEPMFSADYVLTADGGHQAVFGAAGVNHHWSPPAIAPHNAVRGTPRAEFACDVLFVGSWRGGYHEEWQHRPYLIKHLRRRWGKRLLLLPPAGAPRIVGADLADAYASATVVVGDSCLVPKVDGSPMDRYTSDRVPESLGRGAYLLHPFVDGAIGDAAEGDLWTAGEHLGAWTLWDWDQLDAEITRGLDDSAHNADTRTAGYRWTKGNHTYEHRLDWALGLAGL